MDLTEFKPIPGYSDYLINISNMYFGPCAETKVGYQDKPVEDVKIEGIEIAVL